MLESDMIDYSHYQPDILDDICEMAALLINQWLPNQGWHFTFDNAMQRNGVCRYRTKTISLADFYVRNNPLELVTDTIKHEISHALVGPGHGHGIVWKQTCIKVGARPVRCKADVTAAPGKWKTQCPVCDKVFYAYRRPNFSKTWHCKKCKVTLPQWKMNFNF